jgi:hypothetical protein
MTSIGEGGQHRLVMACVAKHRIREAAWVVLAGVWSVGNRQGVAAMHRRGNDGRNRLGTARQQWLVEDRKAMQGIGTGWFGSAARAWRRSSGNATGGIGSKGRQLKGRLTMVAARRVWCIDG